MKYTFVGVHARTAGIVIGSIVIKKGQSVEVDAASHEVFKKLKTVKHLIETGDLVITGNDKDEAGTASTDTAAKAETKAEKTARLKAEKEAAEAAAKAGNDDALDLDALRVELTKAGIQFEDDETAEQLKEKLDNFKA